MDELIFRQCGKDGYYKIWHTPEKNIFIFIESGEGSIVLRDESYPIAKGVLCFIGENRYHYTFPSEPEKYVRTKLTVDGQTLKAMCEASGAGQALSDLFGADSVRFSVLSGRAYERARSVLDGLYRFDGAEALRKAETSSAVMQLMLILAENTPSERASVPDTLSLAIEYVNKHISEQLTIDGISAASYISKYHLCRLFKSKIGITIMEYVLQTRITAARELLASGELSVTEVSIACGFSSPAYFSRAFKSCVGLSPIRYKKLRAVGEH